MILYFRSGLSLLVVAGVASGCNVHSEPAEALANRRHCPVISDAPVHLAGGSFQMGSEDVYAEEGPVRLTTVKGFWIEPHEVTNRQFGAFVEKTGYVTIAEKPVDPKQFAVPRNQIPPEMVKPGSAVFTPPDRPSNNYNDWWKYVPGANWELPYGPRGPLAIANEPVVHLAWDDMAAYAKWRGGRLPTEAEWEFAALAGEPRSNGQPDEANSWQGVFPILNTQSDGFEGVAPVGCYSPNASGLYDMVGNVWEVVSDFYTPGHDPEDSHDPRGPDESHAHDPYNPGMTSRTVKGGSYLCAPNYCQRYRAASRQGRDPGLGASNVGFRLVYDERPTGTQ